jgi:hypothetical protein
MDTLSWVVSELIALEKYVVLRLAPVVFWCEETVFVLAGWFYKLVDILKLVVNAVWRALKALTHIKFASIWRAITSLASRIRRAYEWYQNHVQERIDRLRRTVRDLYNRFFKPIIKVIDSFRKVIRIIAIFDRRLAAKLDGALFKLEAKIMWPITEAMKRINLLSSYMTAIVTASGLLDRVMTLETIRRDAALVWEVLTNPRQRIFEPIVAPEFKSHAQDLADFRVFLKSDAGPFAERAHAAAVDFRERLALGV